MRNISKRYWEKRLVEVEAEIKDTEYKLNHDLAWLKEYRDWVKNVISGKEKVP
jgi:hypothetical protein